MLPLPLHDWKVGRRDEIQRPSKERISRQTCRDASCSKLWSRSPRATSAFSTGECTILNRKSSRLIAYEQSVSAAG